MILCAAIKYLHNNQEIVVPGWRHGNIYEMMNNLNCHSKDYQMIEEGFITNTNLFLNRFDAFMHALQCCQISNTTKTYKEEHGERELYSEDLY